jgi:hypothetical protein
MKNIIKKTIFSFISLFLIILVSLIIYALPGGYTGRTKRDTTIGCGGTGCHGAFSSTIVVYFWSPDTVFIGQTVIDTLSVQDPVVDNKKMGMNIAAYGGRLDTVGAGNINRSKKVGDELTHSVIWEINPVKWRFKYTADFPAVLTFPLNNDSNVVLTPILDWNDMPAKVDTIYATVCTKKANWAFANNKAIKIPAPVSFSVQVSLSNTFITNIIDTTGLISSSFTIPAGKLSNNTTYYWRIRAVANTTYGLWSAANKFKTMALTGIGNTNNEIKSFSLIGNYPNPFNPSTKIKFDVSDSKTNIKLSIYNSSGQLVDVLLNQKMSTGSYEIDWNSNGKSSGIYFCRMEAGSYIKSFIMTLVK